MAARLHYEAPQVLRVFEKIAKITQTNKTTHIAHVNEAQTLVFQTSNVIEKNTKAFSLKSTRMVRYSVSRFSISLHFLLSSSLNYS